MNALLLLITIFGTSIQGVSTKAYGKKNGGKGCYLYLTISRVAGIILLALTAGTLSFDRSILPYSLAFGILCSLTAVFNFLAVNSGPLALTSLITSYSLMLPTAYGLIFLRDPVSVGFVPGLTLLLISLFLINKKTTDNGVAITPKWIICVGIMFLTNGGCSIVQSMQQRASGGLFKSEFMIIALILMVVVTFVFSLVHEKEDIVSCTKRGWMPAVVCGAANVIVNLLVMVLQGLMPVSVLFPLISAGSLVLTFFMARFLYKEKLSRVQIIGYILGTLSVVFLNI